MERESERRKREKETGKLIDGRTDKNNLKDRWSDRQTDMYRNKNSKLTSFSELKLGRYRTDGVIYIQNER